MRETKKIAPDNGHNLRILRGDLDNIILMALRKEPGRRYASVKDLSDDITKYLQGLPVSARPNTFFYRASKFYRRNQVASMVGILLALSLIFGIIATTWQAFVARQQRDRAEKRFEEVRKLSNSLLFEITPKIERLQGSTEAREILVSRALEYLDSLARESEGNLGLQSELASAYEKVGEVQGNPNKPNLGDLQGGNISFQKAHVIRLALAEKNPENLDYQRLLAANYNLLGDVQWWASEVEGSLVKYQKAIEIYQNLVSQNPKNLDLNLDLINSLHNQTKVISYNGSYHQSIKNYREMLKMMADLEARFPNNTEIQRLKGYTIIRLGYDLSWENEMASAGEEVKKSLAIYEPLLAANPNDTKIRRDLWFVYFQAGAIYIEANPPLSRQYLVKSAEIAKNTAENDKFDYLAKFNLAQSYSKLGEAFAIEKRFAEAISPLNQAKIILDEITTAEPKHQGYKYALANNYARLAAAQEGAGEFQKAIENYQKAIENHHEILQADATDNMPIRALAIASQDVGQVFEKTKNPEKALLAYQQSLEMFSLLEKKGALGNYDKKNFEASKKALERLQKK